MKFYEKMKTLRKEKGVTQAEMSKDLGITIRTITNYETGFRYPQNRKSIAKIAEYFGVSVNYLLTEDEEFVFEAMDRYGYRGKQQATELLNNVSGLFAGGAISEEDKDELMKGLQEAYWIAKKENKKYAPNKYKEKIPTAEETNS